MIIWLVVGVGVCIVVMFLATALTGAPYVPTHRKEVHESFRKLRPLTANDVVLDIGSGDGVVLQEAAELGARAVGYEINIFLVWISRWRLRRYEKVTVHCKNLWTADFPDDVSVVYTFGDSRDIKKMYKKVQQQATRLGRPIDFVSYGFWLHDVDAIAVHRAHRLYTVLPLHTSET